MALQFDAVYENGVLRPLQPLDLNEHERVIVSLVKQAPLPGRSRLDVAYIERIKAQPHGAEEASTLEAVRERLSKIPGSMAADIVADRGES
jgi:predicted DNA-binding antitoxin AbrB/MazE fold protein